MRLFRRARETTREEVEREMRSLGWWYQHFELPNGVWTGDGNPPAYDPRDRWNAFEPYLPADLSGKTALDVGGNSGFFAIQMMLRGAKRVVLVEPFKEFTDQARFAADQFGVKLEIVNADVHTYCLTTEERFAYVLFLGLFYQLKYPGLVLDRLAEMTKERCVLQSHSVGPRGRGAAGAARSGERHRRPALPSAGVRRAPAQERPDQLVGPEPRSAAPARPQRGSEDRRPSFRRDHRRRSGTAARQSRLQEARLPALRQARPCTRSRCGSTRRSGAS